MHPAVADCCLHLSAIPDSPTAEPTLGRVPMSLSALAAPARRGALLRSPWASTESVPQGSAVLGNMVLAPNAEASRLRVSGLLSKGMTSVHQPGVQHGVSVCLSHVRSLDV